MDMDLLNQVYNQMQESYGDKGTTAILCASSAMIGAGIYGGIRDTLKGLKHLKHNIYHGFRRRSRLKRHKAHQRKKQRQNMYDGQNPMDNLQIMSDYENKANQAEEEKLRAYSELTEIIDEKDELMAQKDEFYKKQADEMRKSHRNEISLLEGQLENAYVGKELTTLRTAITSYMEDIKNYLVNEHDEVDRDRDQLVKRLFEENVKNQYHNLKIELVNPSSEVHGAIEEIYRTAETLFPRARNNLPETPQKLLEIIDKATAIQNQVNLNKEETQEN